MITRGIADIWLLHKSAFRKFQSQANGILSQEEVARANRFEDAEARLTYQVTRTALRILLSSYRPEVTPSSWKFKYNSFGKPEIDGSKAGGLGFNVSHAKGMSVLAFTLSAKIGIDIESRSRGAEFLEVAKEYFSPDEVREVFSDPENTVRKFMEFWTMKEAVLKAQGAGLTQDLGKITLSFESGIPKITSGLYQPENWQLHLFKPNDLYQCALAVESETAVEPSIRMLE